MRGLKIRIRRSLDIFRAEKSPMLTSRIGFSRPFAVGIS